MNQSNSNSNSNHAKRDAKRDAKREDTILVQMVHLQAELDATEAELDRFFELQMATPCEFNEVIIQLLSQIRTEEALELSALTQSLCYQRVTNPSHYEN